MHKHRLSHPHIEWLVNDSQALAVDIQMKLVAEQEDAYWQEQFAQESYYIAGRGYDQYQPAYMLGWRTALECPDAKFADLLIYLEEQWDAHRAASLLPWREVHEAVKSAWEHANSQMKTMQWSSEPRVLFGADVASALQPLRKSCQSLGDELLRVRAVSMNDFAHQVIDRHACLLIHFAQELGACFEVDPLRSQNVKHSEWGWHAHWRKIRTKLSEQNPRQIFERCEKRERALLAMYQNLQHQELPDDVRVLLAQQQKVVQKQCEKLVWMQENWSLY